MRVAEYTCYRAAGPIQIDGKLDGLTRLLVIGFTPAAHAPQAVGIVADFKARAAKFAVFHDCVL